MGGRDLPWVIRLPPTLAMNFLKDTRQKKAAFITRSLEVREQFSFAHPMEILQAVRVNCCDQYGSMLCDLQRDMGGQFFTA